MKFDIQFFGGGGASSGIKRQKTTVFTRKGLEYNQVNKEAVSAILKAPAGTEISYKHTGFGSYAEGKYTITTRGSSQKMLTRIDNEGHRTGRWILNRSNVNKYLGMAQEIKMTQSK